MSIALCVDAFLIAVFFVIGKVGYKIILPERNVVALFFQCSWVRELPDMMSASEGRGSVKSAVVREVA